MTSQNSPLQSPGLSRRVYPFLGLAIVGMVTIGGLSAAISSPALGVAVLIGALMVLAPLAPVQLLPSGRLVAAIPVALGFGLAAFPLWAAGTAAGIATTLALMAVGCSLIVVPWERIPRFLHAISPIGGLLVALFIEAQYGSSVLHAFPFVLLPLLFLALYFTTVEFAVGAILAVVNIVAVAVENPKAADSSQALLASLTLVALGLLVRRVVSDLQTSRAAESMLRSSLEKRNDQLQEMTRMKSEFLASMSHEIRTPMNGVIGMTGLLLSTDLSAEQRDYVDTIRTSGDTLLEIINDILDFSKIEAGRVRMESVDFSPKHVTEEAVELFAEAAANKGIELILDVEPDIPGQLVGDPGRLRQILLNLIGNAVKFTDAGEVVVRVIRRDAKGPGLLLHFEVTDTGIGLTEAEMAQVFTTYSQVDSSTTRRHGGTGLGLSIARMLTQLMGGEIGVDSNKGSGSRFWFTAMFRESTTKTVSASAHVSLVGTPVAIIDDNRTNRTILERYVDSWGMRQRSFEGGPEALHEMRRMTGDDKFDVAIIDLMMPGMDGKSVAAEIRGDAHLRDMVVVLLTSAGHSERPVPGVDYELVKPVRPSELFDVLHTLLASRPEYVERKTVGDTVPPQPARDARVLVVEDNVANIKVAVRMIERLGYRADMAGNGLEAVSALGKLDYDAVLMDCQMPEMDGYEATRQIRRQEQGPPRNLGEASDFAGTKTRHTPIIAMTASAMSGDRERCLAAGMDDYISKPIKLHVLAALLERWLGPGPVAEEMTAEVL